LGDDLMRGRSMKRLAALEAEQRGPQLVHCILLYDGQAHDEALAIHEHAKGTINDPDRSDLYVYVRKFAPPPGPNGSYAA
jgi:hypothetical protein